MKKQTLMKALVEITQLIDLGNSVLSTVYRKNQTHYVDEDKFYEWKNQAMGFFNFYFGDDSNFYLDFKKESISNLKIPFLNAFSVISSCKCYLDKIETDENHDTYEDTHKSVEKIFISHASKDKNIVGLLIDLIEGIGVPQDKIFCSSFEGYGIKLGQNFLDTIKEELNLNTLVLFILSKNFYESEICLCEMGAAWVKTHTHIPMLIPPFDFKDVKGVIPLTQGFKIDDIEKLNSFKSILVEKFTNKDIGTNPWERKRKTFIEGIKRECIVKNDGDFGEKGISQKIIEKYKVQKITVHGIEFNIGDIVTHRKFGEGEIVELDSEEGTTIKFINGGTKRLMLPFANLSILKKCTNI